MQDMALLALKYLESPRDHFIRCQLQFYIFPELINCFFIPQLDIVTVITMAHQHCNAPCSVPPHPDLLTRTKVEALTTNNASATEPEKKASRTLRGEKGIPGMNDGTIFPRSHYEQPTSIMAMSNGALKRKPLRGTLRY